MTLPLQTMSMVREAYGPKIFHARMFQKEVTLRFYRRGKNHKIMSKSKMIMQQEICRYNSIWKLMAAWSVWTIMQAHCWTSIVYEVQSWCIHNHHNRSFFWNFLSRAHHSSISKQKERDASHKLILWKTPSY